MSTTTITELNAKLSTDMLDIAKDYDLIDFIDGQRDCKNNAIPRVGASDSYTAGYSAQYQLEQIMGELHG